MNFLKNKHTLYLTLIIIFSSCATVFTGLKDNVVIDSYPQGATVQVNKQKVGETPLAVDVKRSLFKKQKITLTKNNYEPIEFDMIKGLNYSTILNIELFYLALIDVATGSIIQYKNQYTNQVLQPIDASANKGEIHMKDAEDIHIWNKKIRLNWNFFQGHREKITTDKMIQVGAVTYSGFAYGYDKDTNEINLHSFAFFDTQQSWVGKKQGKMTYNYFFPYMFKNILIKRNKVLNHEQRHFDISEIYARKFKRKAIELCKTTPNVDSLLNTLYTHYYKKLSETQHKYDFETEHGMNKEMQKVWNKAIDDEIQLTIEFENPHYQIKL